MRTLSALAQSNIMNFPFVVAVLLSGFLTVPVERCQSPKAVSSAAPQVRELSFGDFVHDVAYSFDGSLLAVGGVRRPVKVWSTNEWKLLYELKHPGDVYGVVFSPSAKLLATITEDGELSSVWLWDITRGEKVGTYSEVERGARITSIAFSPDGKVLAIGLGKGTVRLLDLTDPTKVQAVNQNLLTLDTGISSLSFSPDSKLLAVGAGKGVSGPRDFGTFKVVEAHNGREVFKHTDLSIIYNLVFSPDGKTLAVAGARNIKSQTQLILTTFSTNKWGQVQLYDDHPVGVGLNFSKDSHLLVSAFPNPPESSVVVMDLLRGRILRTINTPRALTALSLSPNGKNIAVGDEKGVVIIYPIELTSRNQLT
jgi:WD40 repeat protein